ncbi:hypothetical protein [Methanosarcina horonobensis]|uniref:hypothetical protein n=1 Tax=Methanosarcina horonobensis TaxID=418008 RepID=UPI000A81C50B|nr:hypothetical protein [Methanosarcina horonobensis]
MTVGKSGHYLKSGQKFSFTRVYGGIIHGGTIQFLALLLKKVKILVHISFWQNQKNICINSTHTKEILSQTLGRSGEKVNSP